MSAPRPMPGRKQSAYSLTGKCLKGWHHYVGKHQTTRKRAARADRHATKRLLRGAR